MVTNWNRTGTLLMGVCLFRVTQLHPEWLPLRASHQSMSSPVFMDYTRSCRYSMCAGNWELNPGLQASQARTIAPDCGLTHGSTPNATPILIFDAEMFVSLQEVFSYMEILRTAWLTRQNRTSISWGRLLEKGQEEYGLGFSSSSIRADLGLVLRAFFFESWRREPE